ncbi:hypothetical protein [Listeria monocytogenes]|uniref:hypothetical protein n=1 Tax=Listeria monocytogenes TaxID=1639 RepID=UPI001D312CE5|nr:hypothetical protein [Listeria monocytogenes]EHR0727123.1 hypothetical protein [Listeria monocytogenes]EHR0727871.1 hypothetical protein [Listeria monocytogenes]MCD2222833.1 hypothetical protein [Listeria monocytogenes]
MNNEVSIFNPENSSNLPMMTRWAIEKQGNEQIKTVMVSKIQEDGKPYLTSTVLEHTAALSSLEQHLSQVTPHAEARYRHIVDSYVASASRRISG